MFAFSNVLMLFEFFNFFKFYCLCEKYYKPMIVDYWASLVAQTVKNPLAMQESQVWSLGREDPLKKGMATHSSILAWRIPWTEEPGGL